ncbi:MAG: T9SS type A sorting domain-containing protein [Ignavibacteria bacterium]|nr:T9SS type A sorting domain-containing protein [Ignavibacteria bacterium]
MKSALLIILASFFIYSAGYSQQRMNAKPEGFDPSKIKVEPERYVPVNTEKRTITTVNGTYMVDPNIRILPTSGNQTELSASIWTQNPNYVFVGANSDPGQGYYFTTNGGTTWLGGDLLPNSVAISSDPAVVFNRTGTLFFNYFDNIMVTDRSSNGGSNWQGRVTVPTSGSFDKNHMAIDDNPTSPYYGRIYVVWTQFVSPNPTVLSYSTNGGATYSAQQQIGSPIASHYEQGCNIQVGPDGTVYCIWACPNTGSGNVEDLIGFTKSTNGGVTWSAPTTPLTIKGIRGNILTTNIRVNSFPSMAVDRSGGPRNGYIYVTWTQRNLAPAGSDADICFAYSSNGGVTWSAQSRVNNDALNNGKNQFFPWMTLDQSNGRLAIVFYDQRDCANNDSVNTYIAVSNNGGGNWDNIRVSDRAQRPAPLSGYASGYYGDYIAIASHNNVIWPFWMDNRSGPAQIYTVKVQSAVYPLSAFNLQNPAAGSRIVTVPGSTTPVTLSWDTSATGATYKWIFGNPTISTRRITIPNNTNSITMTLGELDAMLASAGFTNNGSATDSAVGQYNVWAFKNPSATGVDSLSAANGPRALTLRRQAISLTAFSLSSPSSPTTILTSANGSNVISFNWTRSGAGSTYRFVYKTGTLSDPVTLRLLANNSGLDSVFSLTSAQLDAYIAGLGVAAGDSITGQWAIRAYSSLDSLQSTAPARTITFRRSPLMALNQDFASTTFPPEQWTLQYTGTQYWTRQAVSGYGTGTGSARYNMWNASAGTTQSITSNVFPAVTASANYLRFNYAYAYYLSGGTTLSADSVGIFTSTNAGTTWTPLITMKATQTPQVGVNSTNNLSTAASQSQFTPTATQWGTKIYAMPIGTNQVRFTGYSVFGNDAFIDDITAGGPTALQTPLTLAPEKFELMQNYPNPFNPATKISFSIPKNGFVSLKVYDILGKEVASLVNEDMTAGIYDFDFNGAALASGMYFYRLEANGFTDTKRMMLVK